MEQENKTYNDKINQYKHVLVTVQMIELIDEDLKTVIVPLCRILKNVDKGYAETWKILKTKAKTKKTKIELLEVKMTMSKMENMLNGINNRIYFKRKGK